MADKKSKEKKSPYALPLIMLVMSSICIPYVYYAVLVKNYINANWQPHELEVVPQLKDFYKTLIGAAVTQVVRLVIRFTLY